MKAGRIIAIVLGALRALPALGLFFGGTALTVGYATEREDDGYFDATLDRDVLFVANVANVRGVVDIVEAGLAKQVSPDEAGVPDESVRHGSHPRRPIRPPSGRNDADRRGRDLAAPSNSLANLVSWLGSVLFPGRSG